MGLFSFIFRRRKLDATAKQAVNLLKNNNNLSVDNIDYIRGALSGIPHRELKRIGYQKVAAIVETDVEKLELGRAVKKNLKQAVSINENMVNKISTILKYEDKDVSNQDKKFIQDNLWRIPLKVLENEKDKIICLMEIDTSKIGDERRADCLKQASFTSSLVRAINGQNVAQVHELLKSEETSRYINATYTVPKGGDKKSPLHIAMCTGNVEIIQKLIEVGADPFAKDKAGVCAATYLLGSAPERYRPDTVGITSDFRSRCVRDNHSEIFDVLFGNLNKENKIAQLEKLHDNAKECSQHFKFVDYGYKELERHINASKDESLEVKKKSQAQPRQKTVFNGLVSSATNVNNINRSDELKTQPEPIREVKHNRFK